MKTSNDNELDCCVLYYFPQLLRELATKGISIIVSFGCIEWGIFINGDWIGIGKRGKELQD